MNPLIIMILVVVVVVICCAYPYSFETAYVEKYGGKGLSYIFAAMLGVSTFWLSFQIETPETWQYSAAIILVITSVTLCCYRIYKEVKMSNAPIGWKVQFAICQFLFSIGVFGILFIMLFMVYLFGGGGKRKKKR